MAEGINVSDENGSIFYTNPAFDAMFGYSRGELTGAHVSSLSADPLDASNRLKSIVVAALKTEGNWSGEFQNRKKDGSNFFTSARISTLNISGRTCVIAVQRTSPNENRSQMRSDWWSQGRLTDSVKPSFDPWCDSWQPHCASASLLSLSFATAKKTE